MTSRIRRTLSLLSLLLVFSLPLQAEPVPPRAAEALSGFLSGLWARLGDSLTSVRATDETDGRGALDPDGRTAPTDGRGACDPDGAPTCGT